MAQKHTSAWRWLVVAIWVETGGFESAKACFAETSMQTLTTQTLFTNAFGSTTPMATSLLTMSCMFRPWVLYGEHLAMAKTSTQTLSIVQRRTRITNFRGKSCSLLTMSCMFLPWSLNAGNGEAWQQRCAAIWYILVLDWHIFTNPWLFGIDKDWLVDSGWGWIPNNNTPGWRKHSSAWTKAWPVHVWLFFLYLTSSASAQHVQLTVPLCKKLCLSGK